MQPTEEQQRFRELVVHLQKEEWPLTVAEHAVLAPFVDRVREEIKEDLTPGRRRVYRVTYYMLNERGLKLYHRWQMGDLDELADKIALQRQHLERKQ